MRIAIVSDTHLSPRAPAFDYNLAVALAWVEAARIDLIVNLGDVTADGVSFPEEFDHAGRQFSAAPVRMLAVPGNHDIGEALKSPRSSGEAAFSEPALDEFRNVLGPDRWSIQRNGWQLVGLNAQLYGNGDTAEAEQDAWLDTVLMENDAPLGLFLHKPLFRDGLGGVQMHQRYLPPDHAAGLLARTTNRDLRFVIAGHTHQHRRLIVDDVEHVWAPSLAYVIPDTLQERIGEKLVAMMVLELEPDAHRFELVTPAGIVANDLRDCAALYPHLAIPVDHGPNA
ncbi:MAG: metallophosphoesterase [Sphingomonas sp.]|uniref:metallophosphoesterase family protein n=1 Tax=Sphingomonas sp. TaxID=28214 RepID=UPI001AD5CBA7|nr:metallophosphoesterase [Sphingomonas sp.]MBN8816321.1 metallophosphoesterase [Sphingomonas sp.]